MNAPVHATTDIRPPRPWWDARRPAGFRLSGGDAVILGFGLLLTVGAWQFLGEWALVLPVVLGHFFLFCNVFRIGTRRELLWAGGFVVNVAGWCATARFTWARVLLSQGPVTLAVIAWAMAAPDYHGAGWRWIRMGDQ